MSRNKDSSSCRQNRTIPSAVVRCWMLAAILSLFAGKSSFSFRLAPSLPQKAVGSLTNLYSKMPSSSFSASPRTHQQLEVEQKFPFSDRSDLEKRLRKEGFAPVTELTMVDWYFDRFEEDGTNGFELPLIRRDHWLRYRETITENRNTNDDDGQWQLKRGNKGGSGGGTTVYEEVEGIRALEIAHSILREHPSPSPSSRSKDVEEVATRTFDGHPIPVLPIPGCDVVPLARIVAHRAKWKQQQRVTETTTATATTTTTPNTREDENTDSDAFPNLVVDLDTTPDGFAVGEVEAMVQGEECDSGSTGTEIEATEAAARNDRAVAQARNDIQRFLAILLRDDLASSATTNRRPPMGKLEQFLFKYRPQMYKACVKSGVIPEPPPTTTTATTPTP